MSFTGTVMLASLCGAGASAVAAAVVAAAVVAGAAAGISQSPSSPKGGGALEMTAEKGLGITDGALADGALETRLFSVVFAAEAEDTVRFGAVGDTDGLGVSMGALTVLAVSRGMPALGVRAAGLAADGRPCVFCVELGGEALRVEVPSDSGLVDCFTFASLRCAGAGAEALSKVGILAGASAAASSFGASAAVFGASGSSPQPSSRPSVSASGAMLIGIALTFVRD
jgi:hypothetical protein